MAEDTTADGGAPVAVPDTTLDVRERIAEMRQGLADLERELGIERLPIEEENWELRREVRDLRAVVRMAYGTFRVVAEAAERYGIEGGDDAGR